MKKTPILLFVPLAFACAKDHKSKRTLFSGEKDHIRYHARVNGQDWNGKRSVAVGAKLYVEAHRFKAIDDLEEINRAAKKVRSAATSKKSTSIRKDTASHSADPPTKGNRKTVEKGDRKLRLGPNYPFIVAGNTFDKVPTKRTAKQKDVVNSNQKKPSKSAILGRYQVKDVEALKEKAQDLGVIFELPDMRPNQYTQIPADNNFGHYGAVSFQYFKPGDYRIRSTGIEADTFQLSVRKPHDWRLYRSTTPFISGKAVLEKSQITHLPDTFCLPSNRSTSVFISVFDEEGSPLMPGDMKLLRAKDEQPIDLSHLDRGDNPISDVQRKKMNRILPAWSNKSIIQISVPPKIQRLALQGQSGKRSFEMLSKTLTICPGNPENIDSLTLMVYRTEERRLDAVGLAALNQFDVADSGEALQRIRSAGGFQIVSFLPLFSDSEKRPILAQSASVVADNGFVVSKKRVEKPCRPLKKCNDQLPVSPRQLQNDFKLTEGQNYSVFLPIGDSLSVRATVGLHSREVPVSISNFEVRAAKDSKQLPAN